MSVNILVIAAVLVLLWKVTDGYKHGMVKEIIFLYLADRIVCDRGAFGQWPAKLYGKKVHRGGHCDIAFVYSWNCTSSSGACILFCQDDLKASCDPLGR